MIRINLLPPEYRVSESTPLPRIITVYTGVALTCALGLWLAHLTFIKTPALESEKTQIQNSISVLQVDLKEYQRLMKQRKGFIKRSDTIDTLVSSRISIQQVMDETTSLIDPTAIWIKRLSLSKIKAKTSRRRRAPAKKTTTKRNKKTALAAPTLRLALDCTISTPGQDLLERLAEFFDIFKTHPYWHKAAVPPRFEGVKIKDNVGAFKINLLLRQPPAKIKTSSKKNLHNIKEVKTKPSPKKDGGKA